MNLEKKEFVDFQNRIKELAKEDLVIAFSGGADSALLLKAAVNSAKEYETKVHAVTVQTRLHPQADLEEASRVAKEIGAIHHVIRVNEFEDEKIRDNPKDRCYLCKKNIFMAIRALAEELGVKTVLEGTNEDDLHVYRPGIKALKELSIVSPLAESHMTKTMVRELASQYGISVADRPAAPCLATRLPYGHRLDEELLRRIDRGEEYLKSLQLYNVRLRVHADVARIEVDQKDLARLVSEADTIVAELKQIGFKYITLDLEGFRSGSMDE